MASKHAAIASHVRRLCSSGLAPRLIIPLVVAELRKLVGADWSMVFYADKAFNVCDIYTENQAVFDILPVYMAEFHNKDEQRSLIGADFEESMRRGRGYENSLFQEKALLHSAFFAECWRPLGVRHSLEMTASDGRRGWGSVQFQRSFDARPFTTNDQALIAPFNRHIAHALTAPTADVTQFAENGRAAVAIVDETGKIDLASADALDILSLAGGAAVGTARASRVPEWLMPLVANFSRLWRGLPAPPSTMTLRNGAGLFIAKLYALNMDTPPAGRLAVAVHLEHFAPRNLQVELVGYQMGLSDRQRQMCADLLAGYSYSQIALRMSIKESTVVDYVRETYRKVGVHSRRELVRRFDDMAALRAK